MYVQHAKLPSQNNVCKLMYFNPIPYLNEMVYFWEGTCIAVQMRVDT